MMRNASGERLAAHIRERQSAVIEAWSARMRATGKGARPFSTDDLPEMLERIARAIETSDDSVRPTRGLANEHAIARLRAGYRLREVVAEFRLLRRVLIEQMEMLTRHDPNYVESIALLHSVIDHAVANAVDEYTAERDRTRDRFISILSHDLSQPLNAIRFGAETLVRTAPVKSGTHKTAALVASSATRMHTMIADLLDFARGRAGQTMPITPTRVNAALLMYRITDEIATAHPERSIQCLVADQGSESDVEWDQARMTQALSNVLTNALTHGGDPVVLEAGTREDCVCIEVRNQGEIPTDVWPRLFEPFAGNADRRGLGLGLYIVERVVSAHGGTVRARSSGGVTSIRLVVPRRPVATPAPGEVGA
jgi:signal transduction histidine kinase